MFPQLAPQTSDTLAFLIGVPIIAYLLYTALRRARALRQRMEDVRVEMERNPLPPFAQLGQLIDEQDAAARKKRK